MGAIHEERGRRLWVAAEDGPLLGASRDALDLIGDALGHRADAVVVPAARLAPEFFQLRTGIAGEFVQKVVNYQLQLAIVGDIADHVARSDALRDFVRESNRGRHVFFVADLAEAAEKVAASGASRA